MPTLILLRHAKSAYPEGVEDHDRPLSERGHRDAGRAGELLAAGHRFDQALVSSARRAQQTWSHVAAFFPDVEPQVHDDLYLASRDELLARVQGLPDEARSVVVVGHNEGLEQLASVLSQVPTVLKTATVAVLSSAEPWHRWQPGSAALDDLFVARG